MALSSVTLSATSKTAVAVGVSSEYGRLGVSLWNLVFPAQVLFIGFLFFVGSRADVGSVPSTQRTPGRQ